MGVAVVVGARRDSAVAFLLVKKSPIFPSADHPFQLQNAPVWNCPGTAKNIKSRPLNTSLASPPRARFSPAQAATGHLELLDYIRGIAIVGVLFCHLMA